MKKKYIIDSSAFIRYLQKEKGFEIVRAKLIKVGEENNPLILNLINYGEIFYIVKRVFGGNKLDEVMLLLEKLPIALYPITKNLIETAAALKVTHNIPYADAICAATAIIENGTILTSDSDFKKVSKKIPIIWVL